MSNKVFIAFHIISIASYFIVTVFADINNQPGETSPTTNVTITLNDKIHNFLKVNHALNAFEAEPNAPIPKLFRQTSSVVENGTNVLSWVADSLMDRPTATGPSQFQRFGPSDLAAFNVIPSVISEQYIYNVSKSQEYFFEYSYNSSELEHYALRVTLTCEAAKFAMPVMAVARQQRGAVEWQVPLPPPPNTKQQKDYKTVSQTLCPVKSFKYQSHATLKSHSAIANDSATLEQVTGSLSPIQTLSIDVSSQSDTPLPFTLITEYVLNFELKQNIMTSVVVSPSTPVFLQFTFPPGVDTVLVHATSNHTYCGIVAAQKKMCPVHDLESTVKFSNVYQTMSQQAALTLTKEQFPDGFYVTILTLSNDDECDSDYVAYDPDRNKLVHVLVTEKISSEDFILGIAVALLFCSVIYIAVIGKFCYDRRSDARMLSRLGPVPPPRRRLQRRRRRQGSTSSTANLVPSETATDGAAASRPTIAFSSHSSYGVTGGQRSYTPHLVPPSTATAPVVTGDCITAGAAASHQGASGSGGGASSATVLLSGEGMFDDCAELTRELTESLSAIREERPTLASETVDSHVVHDSDSSLNGDDDSYSNDEHDADSAEGGYGGDSQSNFSDSYNQAYDLQGGRTGEIHNVVQNSGLDAVEEGQGSEELEQERRYGASPVLATDKSSCSEGSSGNNKKSINKTLFVRDLTKKRARVLNRRSRRYFTTLLSAFIFYFVPVLQLVSTYQMVLDETGNQDICYYNFMCANPYKLLSDFNHVFSNVGYVMLGLLFAAITFHRQRKHWKEVDREPQVKLLGIPRDYGLYYTLAGALVTEGFLSGAYHVCPNRTNFQFDTAFMYVIAILLMLKLYQQRHPDITASADSVFIALAFAVLFGVCGGLFANIWFWAGTSIIYIFVCMLMSAYVYYLGRWSLIRFLRNLYTNGGIRVVATFIYQQAQSWRKWRTLKSHFGTRVGLLTVVNLSNWAMMLFGVIVQPRDYDTYLLGIFLLNLVLYVMFYLIMKKLYSEHLGVSLALTLLLVVLVWVAAVSVFFQRSTDWSESPAVSRNLNQPCILLNFFDWHDIWHLLSSLALFTSYYLIMIIDDDLNFTPRDMIAVF